MNGMHLGHPPTTDGAPPAAGAGYRVLIAHEDQGAHRSARRSSADALAKRFREAGIAPTTVGASTLPSRAESDHYDLVIPLAEIAPAAESGMLTFLEHGTTPFYGCDAETAARIARPEQTAGELRRAGLAVPRAETLPYRALLSRGLTGALSRIVEDLGGVVELTSGTRRHEPGSRRMCAGVDDLQRQASVLQRYFPDREATIARAIPGGPFTVLALAGPDQKILSSAFRSRRDQRLALFSRYEDLRIELTHEPALQALRALGGVGLMLVSGVLQGTKAWITDVTPATNPWVLEEVARLRYRDETDLPDLLVEHVSDLLAVRIVDLDRYRVDRTADVA